MKLKKILSCILIILLVSFLFVNLALAADGTAPPPPSTGGAAAGSTGGALSGQVKTFGSQVGYGTSGNLGDLAALIINALLGILGLLFFLLIIYGGFLYMTSAGNDEHIKRAKKLISAAVIGLIIVLVSYSLTLFIFKNLPFGTLGTGGAPAANPNPGPTPGPT